MRLDTHQNSIAPVEVHSVGDTRSFGIARNSHMFRILSDGLYSNKIAAVLREVGCNAQDAHVLAGTPDRSIVVKLPTSLDRSFYIQDWGPGLNNDQMFKLYTTYGVSLKQEREDMTGAFGLGSKSPFAYTAATAHSSDGFTVSTVHEGVLRVYTCYINEMGDPCITKMHEGPNTDSSWSSGLKVSFAVQAEDIREFQQEAVNVFKWFSVKPIILGLDADLAKPTYRMSYTAAKLVLDDGSDSSSSYYYRGRYKSFDLLMGNVLYPINSKNIPNLSDMQAMLLGLGGLIEAPIGSVLMAPSREVLQYTATTINYIKGILDQLVSEISARFKEVIDDTSKGRWAWAQALHEVWGPFEREGIDVGFMSKFLKHAKVSDDEISKAVAAVRDRIIPMPVSVGDEKATADGIKVWACFESTRSNAAVSRQQILGGRVVVNSRDGSTASTGLPVKEKSAIVYVDSSYAYDKVKYFFNKNAKDKDAYKRLLIVHAGGNAEKHKIAKSYAEKIGNLDDLRGIDVLSLSALVPDFVATPKVAGSSATGLSWAQKQGLEEVEVYGASGKQALQELLDEYGDENLFYLIHDGDGWRRPYYNANGWSCDTYRIESVIKSIKAVRQHLDPGSDPVVVLVKTEGAVRRLKLEENGFKPLFVDSAKFFEANADKLQVLVDMQKSSSRLSKLIGACGHYAMQAEGLWGIFAYSYVHQTHLWDALKASSNSYVKALVDVTERKIGSVHAQSQDHLTEDERKEYASLMEVSNAISQLMTRYSISGVSSEDDQISELLKQPAAFKSTSAEGLALFNTTGFFNGFSKTNKRNVDNEQLALELICVYLKYHKPKLSTKIPVAPAVAIDLEI